VSGLWLVAACGRIGFDSGSEGAGTADARSCPLIWTVAKGTGTAPSIASGALSLDATDLASGCGSAPLCSGPLQLTQRTLTGDFEVKLSTGRVAAMGGAFVQLFAYPPDTPATWVSASIGPDPASTGNTLGHRLFGGNGVTTQIGAPPANGYVLSILRSGGRFYLGILAGTTQLNLEGPYIADDLIVGIGLANESGTMLAGATHFELLAFSVTGGGGAVVSDTFDCDSLP
jgi:hypothetical protein